MKVLSIDIGITNLGYVYGEISYPSYRLSNLYLKNNNLSEFINIFDCNRVDITHVKHNTVKRCDCQLNHESCIPDYVDHFIQENNYLFESAEIILIERQPPVGITNVQDLLFTKFRSKVIMVSPNSVHKYFYLPKDYSMRKIESEKIASSFLNNFKQFSDNLRKHDISDSMLMLIYYHSLKSEENFKKNKNTIINFEFFRFIKN